MTMIVQLLVFTCACALGATEEVPSYGRIKDSIREAQIILQENILSMEGNIPLLNDSRRHYAEILNVVFTQAVTLSACVPPIPEYNVNYQNEQNSNAPDGLADPQNVINDVNWVIEKVHSQIDQVLKPINEFSLKTTNEEDLNKAVHEEINNNPGKYDATASSAYLAAGIAATQLNHAHKDYFAAASNSLSAHNFVITGAAKMEKLVLAVKNLIPLLRSC